MWSRRRLGCKGAVAGLAAVVFLLVVGRNLRRERCRSPLLIAGWIEVVVADGVDEVLADFVKDNAELSDLMREVLHRVGKVIYFRLFGWWRGVSRTRHGLEKGKQNSREEGKGAMGCKARSRGSRR